MHSAKNLEASQSSARQCAKDERIWTIFFLVAEVAFPLHATQTMTLFSSRGRQFGTLTQMSNITSKRGC